MGDTRFRIYGNEVWHSPQEQTFHQFLDGLVGKTLGKDWFEQQQSTSRQESKCDRAVAYHDAFRLLKETGRCE